MKTIKNIGFKVLITLYCLQLPAIIVYLVMNL